MLELGKISTALNGDDVNIEWRIDGLFSFLEMDDASYESPYFFFGLERWWMVINLNGWSDSNSSGHVHLHLWKCSISSIKQSFSLSLKNVKGEKEYEEHCTKVFEKGNLSHEFNRFVLRSELLRRQTELMPDGRLTFVCTMKNMTSAGSASNTTSAECCHCKGAFNAVRLSSHQKKCMQRPIKCPDCLEVVVLQKWLAKHECQEKTPEGEVCPSRFSISPHEKKVVLDFKELFLRKEDCDVIIKVKGTKIPAHRVILKARSPVFASTFRHDMKENKTGIVEIEDSNPSTFSDFLNFLYCGDVGMISQENVFGLFTVAEKYEVLDLKAKCLEFMKENMTIKTFCETITLALQHCETELIKLATDFFVKNAEEILLTVKWQKFVAENPTQSNELFIKFVRAVKNSSM